MLRPVGNRDREGRALAFLALGLDRSAVQPHQLPHQGETDAGAFERAASLPLDPVEPLEQPWQFGPRNSDAAVADDEQGEPAIGRTLELDRDSALEGEFERVREEIEDNLLPHVAIDIDGLRQLLAADRQGEPGPLGRRFEVGRQFFGQLRQVHRLEADVRAAGFDAGEIKQGIDELQEAETIPVGGLETMAVDRQQMHRRILEHVLDRPEHQRQRRAEFVADVGKEGGLRPVELRQRLRAPPFLLIGLGVGDRRCDLAGGEAEEAPVVVVEYAKRVQSDHKNGCATGVARRRNRNERGLGRRMRPGPGGNIGAEKRFEIRYDAHALRLQNLADRPGRPAVDGDRLGGGRVARRNAAGARQLRARRVALADVDHRERQVVGVPFERDRASPAGLAPVARVTRFGGEVPQERELPRADHPLRIFAVGAEDPSDRPVVARDRAIGKCVVGFFRVAVALHDQELRFDKRPLISAERRVQHRSDLGPYFAPDLARRAAEGPRVLAADDRLVSVVVEVGEIVSPTDPDRLARRQHDPDRHFQALRPGLRRCQGGCVPGIGAQAPAEFSAAGEKIANGPPRGRSSVRRRRAHRRPPGALHCSHTVGEADRRRRSRRDTNKTTTRRSSRLPSTKHLKSCRFFGFA